MYMYIFLIFILFVCDSVRFYACSSIVCNPPSVTLQGFECARQANMSFGTGWIILCLLISC